MKTKEAKDCAAAFAKMIKKKKPEKVWTDKRNRVQRSFLKKFVIRGVSTPTQLKVKRSQRLPREIFVH